MRNVLYLHKEDVLHFELMLLYGKFVFGGALSL